MRKQNGLYVFKGGEKSCWVSKEDKNGWSLGFALNKKTVWLTGLRFASPDEIKRVLDMSLVFVHLKNSKFPEVE